MRKIWDKLQERPIKLPFIFVASVFIVSLLLVYWYLPADNPDKFISGMVVFYLFSSSVAAGMKLFAPVFTPWKDILNDNALAVDFWAKSIALSLSLMKYIVMH